MAVPSRFFTGFSILPAAITHCEALEYDMDLQYDITILRLLSIEFSSCTWYLLFYSKVSFSSIRKPISPPADCVNHPVYFPQPHTVHRWYNTLKDIKDAQCVVQNIALKRQCSLYKTTFRDGQHTTKRDSDIVKEMVYTLSTKGASPNQCGYVYWSYAGYRFDHAVN